jgi:hypothetical protein
VELLLRVHGKTDDRVKRGIHLTINGIAAGLRNSGWAVGQPDGSRALTGIRNADSLGFAAQGVSPCFPWAVTFFIIAIIAALLLQRHRGNTSPSPGSSPCSASSWRWFHIMGRRPRCKAAANKKRQRRRFIA